MSVLAVDGGQSGIRARTPELDPVEVAGVSRLEGDVLASVADRVTEAWEALGRPAVQRAVLGLTTAPVDRGELDRLASLVGAALGCPRVRIADDSVTAFAGALESWGVSLRAGTGVACLAVPRHGGRARVVDGAGYLLGDEGAGYWIGREGLRSVIRAADGRGPSTALTDAATESFGAPEDLAVLVHSLDRPVQAISGFAPSVIALADRDAVADVIVAAAASALADSVAAAVRTTGEDADVPVALGGRLLDGGAALRDRLLRELRERGDAAVVRDPLGSPLDGALRLGVDAEPEALSALIHDWQEGRTA